VTLALVMIRASILMSPSRLALLLLNLIDQQSLEHLLLAHQGVLDVVESVSQVNYLILD